MQIGKSRLEAFSDGVLAIIITIMVLDLKVPHGTNIESLYPLIPIFMCYILSYVYIGIYWNNHHHMLYVTQHVSPGILWANLHLLLWLSLFPFVTGWMGENYFSTLPTALYGFVLLMASIAYYILQRAIINSQGNNSILQTAIGRDIKGKISPLLYLTAILVSFVQQWLACAIYVLVALMWLIPDQRIENALRNKK